MNKYQKTAIPNLPAATGKEQPLNLLHEQIIANEAPKCKNTLQLYKELMIKENEMLDPLFLPTMTLSQLYEESYPIRTPLIDGFLYPGTYLFVGAPKIGKSFFMAQLAYHVSKGEALWGYETRVGTVLYIALEDDYRRLQERLYRMYGIQDSCNLFFAIEIKPLGKGLCEQLQRFVEMHPDTRLVIIDTLQKVREMGGNTYSYASDYETISQLKAFTDKRDISLLVVHHTRKQQSDDKYDSISGTNGLLGAADGAFILSKKDRIENTAVLDVSGRDQAEQRLILYRDSEKLTWELERAETEQWKTPSDYILEKINELLNNEEQEWNGNATELTNALQLDINPNQLTRHLNVNISRLFSEYNIKYEKTRNYASRRISLKRVV